LIRIVSDVHGAVAALRRVAPGSTPLLILGDLINFIDYRNNRGIVSDIAGQEFVDRVVAARAYGDYRTAGELWEEHRRGREDELRRLYTEAIDAAYVEICGTFAGVEAYVTYGNVDTPALLQAHLPETATFIESGVIELDRLRIGIVGG
jgi:hypothetical protein